MGWQDDLLTAPAPAAPAAVPGWQRDLIGAPEVPRGAPQRAASGVLDALQAGYQGSATGLMLRGKLPDVVLDPHNSTWYERALATVGQIGSELPQMIVGGALGTGAGTAAGGAAGSVVPVVGTAAGGVAGGVLGAGAGMFAVPALIRESYIQALSKGEVVSVADFLDRAKIVLQTGGKEGLVGAATMGAGGIAARVAGKAIAPAIGEALSVPAATRVIGAAGTSAEIGTMVVTPAALAGRLPEWQDFADAAIVIGGMKGAHAVSSGLMRVYQRTGIPPEQVAADAAADPAIKAELVGKAEGDIPKAYEPAAEAEMLRNALPEAPKVAEVIANPKGEIPVGKQPNHINYRYTDTPEDMQALRARVSEVFEAEIEAARGTESWAQTQAKAQKIIERRLSTMGDEQKAAMQAMRFEDLAAQSMAVEAMAQKAAFDVRAAAETIRTKGEAATREDMAAQVAAIETMALLHAVDQGNGAEIARALNARKAAKQRTELATGLDELLKKYGDDPHVLANLVLGLHTTSQMANFARKAHKATKWEMFVEAWKAGILSGPVTSVANIMGNKAFELVRSPIDQIAAMIGTARGASVGERISMFEPAARVIASLQASLDGIKSYAAVMDVDVALRSMGLEKAADSVAARRSVDMEPGKSEQFREAIPGAAGYVVRTSFRNLQGQDAFAQTTVRAGEAHALAIRQAIQEGLPLMSREFWNRVEAIKDNPSEAMQKEIDAAALRYTFNEPLGASGQKFQALVKANRLELFFPFIRTPTNIAAEMLRMSVFSPILPKVRADLMGKNGGIARDRAMAEFIVGTSIMAAVSYYFFDGSISGAGDPDAGKRNVKRAAGWQPYSFKVGDTWYNYQRLQPVGTLVGLAADLANVWDHTDEDERDKIPKMLATAFANAITNQTFLQGVTSLVRAIAEPDRFGPKLVQQYAGSIVPAIVAQPVAMNDPFEREINSMLDAVKARLPGAREALLAKRDVFGEKLQTKERFGVISPITETTESQDKVRSEAARLDVSVANAPKKIHLGRGTGKIGDVKLTPEQQDIFEDVGGNFAYKVLNEIVNAPGWDKIPDLVQKRIYTRVFTQAHKLAAQSVLTDEERSKQMTTIVEKLQTELAPDE